MKIYNLNEVFVPAGFPKITYVERDPLKKKIITAKMNQSKHICIYGDSKSGKSNLWRKNFSEDEYIKIGLNTNSTIDDVYSEILNQLNVYYISEKNSGNEIKGNILAELQAQIKLLFSAKLQSSIQATASTSEKQVLLAKPLLSVNTIIRYLKDTKIRVILEDFHYANQEIIKILAQDLKAFSDEGCQFVLISVPSRTHYLLKENVELQGRLTDVPVGMFHTGDLLSIINNGLEALKIRFSDELISMIIKESNESAAITQDICQKICIECGIFETQKVDKLIVDHSYFEKACVCVAEEQRVTYQEIVNTIGLHEHGNNTTNIYKWILKVVQTFPISEAGITNTEVFRKITELGHPSIQQGSVTSGLGNISKLLDKRNLPQVFDYNKFKTFFVRDKYMVFVFKWLPEMIESLFN